jgi:hypothetical protein
MTQSTEPLGGVVFAASASDLVGLGECGERVRDGHLASLVSFEAHLFEYLTTRQAATGFDDFEELLALATAAAG